MKRIVFPFALLLAFGVSGARAQDHAEVGVFADYFHLASHNNDFVGIGGRAAVNANKWVQIEAEMNYDFAQAFAEGFTTPPSGTLAFQQSNVRLLHGLFGPKFQIKGPVKFFVTGKAGFMDARFDPRPAAFSTFASTLNDLRVDNVKAVVYPGLGFEAFLGPIGLRLEAGDEVYFEHGGHNNLRVTFGPTFRF